MKKFLDLIAGLRTSLKTVVTRANDTLSKLPPLEQYEKTSPVYAGISQCGWAIDFLNHTVQDIVRDLDALNPEQAAKDAADDILKTRVESGELITKEKFDAMLSGGELVKKEDAEAAVKKAADARETAIREELKTVEQRRKEVSTAKSDTEPALIGVELAASLPTEVLKADNYLEQVKKVAGRVKELNDLGIKTASLLKTAAETPVDAKGDEVFSERLSIVKDLAASGGNPDTRVTAPDPLAGGGGGNKEDLVGVF